MTVEERFEIWWQLHHCSPIKYYESEPSVIDEREAFKAGYKTSEWEKACREFLRGCSCASADKQEECPVCLEAFCNHLRELAKREVEE